MLVETYSTSPRYDSHHPSFPPSFPPSSSLLSSPLLSSLPFFLFLSFLAHVRDDVCSVFLGPQLPTLRHFKLLSRKRISKITFLFWDW